MIRSHRFAGTPLFLRIFLVMLASVAAVQGLNFVLVVQAGVPLPPLYTIDQVARALHNGVHRDQDFVISRQHNLGNMSVGEPNGRSERIRRMLAARLGVPKERVRLDLFGPQPMAVQPSSHDLRDEILFDSFVASVRLDDGSWISATPVRHLAQIWRSRALFWLFLSMAAIVPFAWALSRRVAKPIAAFSAAAERLGRDPHAAPLTLVGPPEMVDAAATFNEMQSRLNRYVVDRTIMIGAIAHDLRTPLMRLALRLDGAPEALRKSSENDIRDMEAMIAAVTAFVRDATQPPTVRRALDLRSLLESVTDDLADQNARVSLKPGPAIVLDGDVVALKTLLENLIGNAVRYGGNAEVSMLRQSDLAVIEIRDSGAGIATEDLNQLFEPFFRGERSRNRDTGGVGLGLASARGVARAHGGDITLANRPEGGAIARVTLPLSSLRHAD